MNNALKTRRREIAMTLDAIAQELGVHKSTVLRWEQGRVPPARVLELERITGASRHELRPDIYPIEKGAQ